jgi:protoporphyrinogen oxidase
VAKDRYPTIIVGAGITGLYIGTELAAKQPGQRPLIIEAGDIGGLAAGFRLGGAYLEKFYHYTFQQDRDIKELCEEFTDSRIFFGRTRSGIFVDGKIWPLETPVDLLKFTPIGNLKDRLLTGLVLRELARKDDWGGYDSMTCEELFRRKGALPGYKNLWEPLLKAKFGRDFANAPASFLWGRVNPRARSRSGGSEKLGYLRGGFRPFFEGMARYVTSHGGEVKTHERVTRVIPGETPRVITDKGEYNCSKVVWTAAPDQLADAFETQEGLDSLRSVKYMAASCLILVMSRRSGEFFWVNNIEKDAEFGIVVEHTNLVPPEDYDGRHILYIGNYLPPDHPYLTLGKDELLNIYWPGLKKIYPGIERKDVIGSHYFKNFRACPVYGLNYSRKILPYSGLFRGVDLVGMSQVYPYDRSMHNSLLVAKDYCIKALPADL